MNIYRQFGILLVAVFGGAAIYLAWQVDKFLARRRKLQKN